MVLPLEDVRVIDLGRILPTPFASMMLADMGAEVIKVEDVEDRAGVGRDMLTPPSPSAEIEEKACAYNHLGRNKKSIAMNLRLEEARQVFHRLAAKVDVIIESFRPGVVERLGVGYKLMSQINPRIIYCSLTAYGQDSPYHDLPGHEPEYCAMSGALALTGDDGGEPVIIGANLADVSGALHAVIGILSALRLRDRTGQGQYIDLSIADCMLSFTGVNLALYFRDGFIPLRGWQPPYRHVWQTKDKKFIVVTNPEFHLWQRFCKAIEREDLITKQRPKGEERMRINDEIACIIRTKNRDEWVEILRKAGVSVAPLHEINEVATEPHYHGRGMIMELSHPTLGKVNQLGTPIKLSGVQVGFRSFAPRLGEHTNEIMKSLGYTDEQVKEMRASGAIK